MHHLIHLLTYMLTSFHSVSLSFFLCLLPLCRSLVNIAHLFKKKLHLTMHSFPAVSRSSVYLPRKFPHSLYPLSIFYYLSTTPLRWFLSRSPKPFVPLNLRFYAEFSFYKASQATLDEADNKVLQTLSSPES